MTNEGTVRARLERLLDRLIQGGVVPFIGAGVSNSARLDHTSDLEPTVDWMKQRLRDAIQRDCPPTPDSRVRASLFTEKDRSAHCEDVRCHTGHTEATRDLECLSFDRLAETYTWIASPAKLCNELRISQFADLRPQPAHRYLAYLAREGLIDEIITTNFDCCVEWAYAESFGRNEADQVEWPFVVRNTQEYRERAGRPLLDARGRRSPAFRLYKINGCAKELRERQGQQDPNWPHCVLLMERQLQSFTETGWVRDLFRDRARTRSLLFVGFGSEEPQVRHTALQVSDELTSQSAPETRYSPQEIVELPSAPFLAEHKSPKFAQLQIMTSFVEPYNTGFDGRERHTPGNLDLALWNVFDGQNDGHKIAPSEQGKLVSDAQNGGHKLAPSEEDKLPADVFFLRLYQLAFFRLATQNLQQGRGFHQWVALHARHPGRWLSHLRARLFPDQRFNLGNSGCQRMCGQYDGVSKDLPGAYFGYWRCLLELPKDPNAKRAPMPLFQWLWAMVHPELADEPPEDIYWPLREDGLFILATLMVLTALVPRSNHVRAEKEEGSTDGCPWEPLGGRPRVQPERNRGLVVRYASSRNVDAGEEPRSITLVHPRGLPRLAETPATSRSRWRRVLVVPEHDYARTRRRWEAERHTDEQPRRLRVGHWEAISAAELISKVPDPTRLAADLDHVWGAIRPTESRARLTPISPHSRDSTRSR